MDRRKFMTGRKLRIGKKAWEMSLREIVELIVVAGAIILIWSMIGGIYDIINPDNSGDRSSMNNFNRIAAKMKSMIDGPSAYVYDDEPFYIGEDYAIVGFDTKWTLGKTIHSQHDDSGPMKKPLICQSEACLCIYKGDIEESGDGGNAEKNLKQCIPFKGNVVFLSRFDEEEKPRFCGTLRDGLLNTGKPELDDGPFGYFVIYGDGGGCGRLEPLRLHIEKLSDPDDSYSPIFIYAEIKGDHTSKRTDAIDALTK